MIVTCGEALVDLIPEEVNGERMYRPVPGGSLTNVALGIARLGGTAGYVWELSTDDLGRAVHRRLREAGVDVSCTVSGARATPVALVDLSGTEARYNIADPDRVMDDTAIPPLPAGAACLVIGSAVLAREPVASAIEAAAEGAPLLALDYNVRPPSIRDLAAYRGRLERLSRRAGVVKASVADFLALGEGDPHGAMERLVAEGATLAVLTAAEDGATAWTARARVTAPTRARAVVDTVGAGDAFMAGLLAHLQREGLLSRAALEGMGEAALAAALADAQEAAAFTCRTRGAVMPSAVDLRREMTGT